MPYMRALMMEPAQSLLDFGARGQGYLGMEDMQAQQMARDEEEAARVGYLSKQNEEDRLLRQERQNKYLDTPSMRMQPTLDDGTEYTESPVQMSVSSAGETKAPTMMGSPFLARRKNVRANPAYTAQLEAETQAAGKGRSSIPLDEFKEREEIKSGAKVDAATEIDKLRQHSAVREAQLRAYEKQFGALVDDPGADRPTLANDYQSSVTKTLANAPGVNPKPQILANGGGQRPFMSRGQQPQEQVGLVRQKVRNLDGSVAEVMLTPEQVAQLKDPSLTPEQRQQIVAGAR